MGLTDLHDLLGPADAVLDHCKGPVRFDMIGIPLGQQYEASHGFE